MLAIKTMTPVQALVEALEIPDSAYEAAADRYRDLGEWLHDEAKAKSALFDPEVRSQGSFRLGTANRPWKRESYDLDFGCTFKRGVEKTDFTQEQVKRLLGSDLEAYRRERGIHDELEEKHRCWRLNYQDRLLFHMDVVPSIPHDEVTRRQLQGSMTNTGFDIRLAHEVSEFAVAITDDRHLQYRRLTADWLVSNAEGYALWFEWRVRQAQEVMKSIIMNRGVASIADLPTYKWKTPLQQCVQVLKRHRDVMFENDSDIKPPSIILTTLAARAYEGEADLQAALGNILANMEGFVNTTYPRVPNPVNPSEDFADRWATKEGRELQLEQNFWLWLAQARSDFAIITSSGSTDVIAEQASQKYGVHLDQQTLDGLVNVVPSVSAPVRPYKITQAPKPWCR